MSTATASHGRRAVVRWAWRLFRREWRQQLTLLLLITVAVAASVAATAITANAMSTIEGQFGAATDLIDVDASDAAAATGVVDAVREDFDVVEVVTHRLATVPGLSRPLDVRGQAPDGAYSHPSLALLDGRYPASSDEVAVTNGVADVLAVGIGDRIDLGPSFRTVVGYVENPDDLDDEFALVPPGIDEGTETLTLLVNSQHRTGSAQSEVMFAYDGPVTMIDSLDGESGAVATVLLVAVTLGMALVCLVAASSFVVVAQRRQRQLGLLAAIGASDSHLRLVMVANGAIVGLTGAVAGGVAGIVGWIAAAPAVEDAVGHRIDRFDLPWALTIVCLAIAVVMAVIAAWLPARSVAQLPVTQALSGRPSSPVPIQQSAVLALAAVVAGVAALAFAERRTGDTQPLLLVGGVVAVIVGVVLAAPAAIRVLAALAAALPFAVRLALRDLARYQARAAAALSAITLGIGIAVSIVVLAQTSVNAEDQGNLSDRQLIISLPSNRLVTVPENGLSADLERLDAQAAEITAGLGKPAVLALDIATNPAEADDPGRREPVWVATPHNGGFRTLASTYVATPELLRHYDIEVPVENETELITSLPGDVTLVDPLAPPEPNAAVTRVQRAPLPAYTSAPNSLITQEAIAAHGWTRMRTGWLAETEAPLTPQQITDARETAANNSMAIEIRDPQNEIAQIRMIATLAGALLALTIIAMTVSLVRSESRRDLRTLTATGASANTRRTITATTAGALALLGVILGTTGAYLAIIAAHHADLTALAPAPILNLTGLIIGVPVTAAASGWLLAGRTPTSISRQTLD